MNTNTKERTVERTIACSGCGKTGKPLTFVHSYPYPCRACGHLCETCMADPDMQRRLPPGMRTS